MGYLILLKYAKWHDEPFIQESFDNLTKQFRVLLGLEIEADALTQKTN